MTPEEYAKSIITISKEKLATLPSAEYKGEIFIVDNEEKLEEAIKELRASSIIGFDTETRPSFRKGQTYQVSLIQMATPSKCFLIRTNLLGYPESLINILEDPEILKVGLSIHDDFHNLRKVTDVEQQGFIDLQQFVKNYKISDNSLSRIYGILFGERISKGQRLSNWEAPELSEAQQNYASLDAFACIKIYEYLKGGNFVPKESEYIILPEEHEAEEEKKSE